ncbi:unnamed protein product, partial [Closterium sp. NIES-53]
YLVPRIRFFPCPRLLPPAPPTPSPSHHQAFGTIAESPLHISLSSMLDPTLAELTSFLRKVRTPYYSFLGRVPLLAFALPCLSLLVKYHKYSLLFPPSSSSPLLPSTLPHDSPLQANRSLRQASLCTLNAMLSAYAPDITDAARDALLTELAPLISLPHSFIYRPSPPSTLRDHRSDSDLALAALALQLCCSVTRQAPPGSAAAAAVSSKVLPQALALVRSPLLQGQALQVRAGLKERVVGRVQASANPFDSLPSWTILPLLSPSPCSPPLPRQALQEFFAVQVRASATSFDALLAALLSAGRPFSSSMSPAAAAAAASSSAAARPAFSSVAQCAAVLCVAAGADQCAATVRTLMSNLEGAAHPADTHKQLLSLLCLGEIGRRVDLSAHTTLPTLVMSALASPLEEVKAAASFALGSIAVGNHSQYLPFVLQQIDSQPKLQYLLLHSLKEIISGRAASGSSAAVELEGENVGKVLALLFTHSESDEEGVRNVVAECLGRLALIDPPRLVPALKERVSSPSTFTRATVVASLKFTLTDSAQPIDDHLKPHLASFLFLLRDSDRHVRRAAVLALTTAAHNKPGLVEDLLPELLPLLYDQMRVKPEMIRTVDLGPFKHTVDDGLELRKAAFDCMDTLLSTCLHRIQPAAFITPFLISGLSDNYDVKMPCHLVLAKLAEKCAPSVLAVVEALVDPLEKTVTTRVKADAVKQEVDRNEDMIRSTLRAVHALSKIRSLRDNFLHGSIPSEIGNLVNLTSLDLTNNSFSGPFPTSFSRLTKLSYLYLSLNKFSGSIDAIGNIISLNELHLSHNLLSGTIPQSFSAMTSLRSIWLGNNLFTGPLAPLAALYSLTTISMCCNRFNGSIPTFASNPTDFDVSVNDLTGPLPSGPEPADGLNFNVSYNRLSGEIPFEFNAAIFSTLDISHNNLSGRAFFTGKKGGAFFSLISTVNFAHNRFSGALDPSLSTLTYLYDLDISGNLLTGSIPAFISRLTYLTVLDLSSNQFTGTVPPAVSNPTGLVSINLAHNLLQGSIPRALSRLSSLTYLNMSSNQLSGDITPALSPLRSLEIVDISANTLNGSVPLFFGRMPNMTHMNMAINLLSGSLPPSIFNLRQLSYLNVSRNRLSGPLPNAAASPALIMCVGPGSHDSPGNHKSPGNYEFFGNHFI